MRKLQASAFATVVVFSVSLAFAQDGWFSTAPPPIVVRLDSEANLHFTNASDKILHAITIHAQRDGKEWSAVIIDIIEPHKT